jgi:TPP-dependent pyruvate/acetoin dehydrogenase alpha subunit
MIRAFEEKAPEIYARGKINGLLHLGICLEGVAAAVFGDDAGHAGVFHELLNITPH